MGIPGGGPLVKRRLVITARSLLERCTDTYEVRSSRCHICVTQTFAFLSADANSIHVKQRISLIRIASTPLMRLGYLHSTSWQSISDGASLQKGCLAKASGFWWCWVGGGTTHRGIKLRFNSQHRHERTENGSR